MMKTTILCIGHPQNPHVQQVQKQVKSIDKEARMMIFNPGLDGHFIEITEGNLSDESPSCVFTVDGESVSSDSITSVWYNFRPDIQDESKDLQEHIASDFIDREWKAVIFSLASWLSHARWLNPLTSWQLWNTKAYQLRLAQDVGLSVPRTTITNNAAAVQKLLMQGRVIFKTMSPLLVSGCPMFVSNEIPRDFPSECQARIAKCPSFFQELVKRGSELRIFVVDRKVSAVRIVSQTLDEVKDGLDAKQNQETFTEVQLPESFKERLLEFHKKAGLVLSTYEFVERNDDIIFLDCNPEGAWVCLERAVGLKVSEHIARYLLGKEESDSF